MASELDFKKWLKKAWEGWCESYEPRRGSGVGMPDVQLLLFGHMLPVELKVGRIEVGDSYVGDRIFVEKIEPAQIVWHRDLWRAGGRAYIWVGVKKSGWYDVWCLPREALHDLSNWREGWLVEDCTKLDISTLRALS